MIFFVNKYIKWHTGRKHEDIGLPCATIVMKGLPATCTVSSVRYIFIIIISTYNKHIYQI